jgi:hypothetical protein
LSSRRLMRLSQGVAAVALRSARRMLAIMGILLPARRMGAV